jgi:hypothetical protein
VEEALRLLASGEALEQMLQVCEQDMAVTDEALSDLRRTGLLSGKRKRGEELASQAVRHSLWEQDSLEAYNELLFGHLDPAAEGPLFGKWLFGRQPEIGALASSTFMARMEQ